MHINKETAEKLVRNELDFETKCECLAHIALCSECAELLSDAASAETPVPMPAGFAESTLLAAFGNEAVQQKPKTESLTVYSIKVIAAMCASLVLLFSGFVSTTGSGYLSGVLEKTTHYSQQFEKKLEDFSKQRYNDYLEENYYADKT